jgi:hypothetical protein
MCSAFRKLVIEKGIKFQEFYAKFSYLVTEGHITT